MRKILVSVFLVSLLAFPAMADNPTVNILAPTGTVFVGAFPYTTNLTVQVSHPAGALSDLNVFDVKVSQVSPVSTPPTSILLAGPLGNPFPGNVCSPSQMVIAKGVTSCGVSSGIATVSVSWTISGPGTYMVEVSLKHQSAVGDDAETVVFNLIAAEYPAPPAIANAYINANARAKKASPTVRGCVIAQIAQNHGQTQKYDPAPGPYNDDLVQSDVRTYWSGCGGGTFPSSP